MAPTIAPGHEDWREDVVEGSPAVFCDAIMVRVIPAGVRIAFGEVSPKTGGYVLRSVVVVSKENALWIGEIVKELTDESAPAIGGSAELPSEE